MPSLRHLILILLYVGWCISYVDRTAITYAATHIASDFHLSPASLGVLLSSFYVGYSIMQIPGGWLSDRFGSGRVVLVSILLWSLFTSMTGLAWSLASLIVIRFLFGIAEGAFPAASMKGVAESFTAKERPTKASILISSNYTGSMLAPLLITPLLLAFHWRTVFHIIAVLGIVFAVLYAMVYRRQLREQKAQAITMQPINKEALMELLRSGVMWKLVLVWFALSLVNKGLDSWMPIYLMTERGLNLKTVGILMPLPFVLAAVSAAVGGWVMLRWFNGRENILLFSTAALTACCVYGMYQSTTITGLIVFQCAAYFFKSFVMSTCMSLPSKILPAHQVGTAAGMVNFGGQTAGFISPVIIGLLIGAQHHFDAAFNFLLLAAVASALIGLLVQAHRHQSSQLEGSPSTSAR